MSNWSRDLYGLKTLSEVSASATINAGSLTLDLSTAGIFYVNLNANITTLTISSVPSIGASTFTLILTGDGTLRTITWPSKINWPDSTTPTLTTANGYSDIFSFMTLNGGSVWYGFIGGQIYASNT